MIRVVVIDDSAFMRKALSIMLESDPEIQVVGTARDGEEGFQIVNRLKPIWSLWMWRCHVPMGSSA
jgi:two-component system chemotaxis response regulator CheB